LVSMVVFFLCVCGFCFVLFAVIVGCGVWSGLAVMCCDDVCLLTCVRSCDVRVAGMLYVVCCTFFGGKKNSPQNQLQMHDFRTNRFLDVFEGLALSFLVTGLRPVTEYRFRLRASNDKGVGEWSDEVPATTETGACGLIN